jgi:hypothetical protein
MYSIEYTSRFIESATSMRVLRKTNEPNQHDRWAKPKGLAPLTAAVPVPLLLEGEETQKKGTVRISIF